MLAILLLLSTVHASLRISPAHLGPYGTIRGTLISQTHLSSKESEQFKYKWNSTFFQTRKFRIDTTIGAYNTIQFDGRLDSSEIKIVDFLKENEKVVKIMRNKIKVKEDFKGNARKFQIHSTTGGYDTIQIDGQAEESGMKIVNFLEKNEKIEKTGHMKIEEDFEGNIRIDTNKVIFEGNERLKTNEIDFVEEIEMKIKDGKDFTKTDINGNAGGNEANDFELDEATQEEGFEMISMDDTDQEQMDLNSPGKEKMQDVVGQEDENEAAGKDDESDESNDPIILRIDPLSNEQPLTLRKLRSVVPPPPSQTAAPAALEFQVRMPPRYGARTRGVMFGDICISSKYVPCTFGQAYHVAERIAWLLNSLAEQNGAIDFWALLGDNFYDQDGSLSRKFFRRLSVEATAVPLYSVPGNHDFWTYGLVCSSKKNQFGVGYMQFYGIDTQASATAKNQNFPFDLNGFDPNAGDLPRDSNFFHTSLTGDLGFIAFSGAHDMRPELFKKSCEYLRRENAAFVFLLGHWSSENMGCKPGMDSANVLLAMQQGKLGGDCLALAKLNVLYFVDGHSHENRIVGQHGFRVGGQGMFDTGHFGFPMFELVRAGLNTVRLIVSYVALAQFPFDPRLDFRFAEFRRCARDRRDAFACLDLPFVRTWLNVTRVYGVNV